MGLEFMPAVRVDKRPGTKQPAHALADSYKFVIPATVRRLYNISTSTLSQGTKISQGVIEFLPVGHPQISDMQKFATLTGESFNNVSKIVGPWDFGGNGESTLDVEYLYQLAQGANNYYTTIADGWAYTMALNLFNMADPPMVSSVSYGWPESGVCQTQVTHAQNCTSPGPYIARSEA